MLQRAFPADGSEWASLSLPGTPSHLYTFQEASGNVVDQVAATDLQPNFSAAYRQSGESEPTLNPRYSIASVTTNQSERFDANDIDMGNLPGTPGGAGEGGVGHWSMYCRFKIPSVGSTARRILGKGTTGGAGTWNVYVASSTGRLSWNLFPASGGSYLVDTDLGYDDGAFHDLLLVWDYTVGQVKLITESEEFTESILGLEDEGITNSSVLRFLCTSGTTTLAGTAFSYAAIFEGQVLDAEDLAAIRTPIVEVADGDEAPALLRRGLVRRSLLRRTTLPQHLLGRKA